MSPANTLQERIKKTALLNAINHDGKAQQGPVMGKLLAEHPQLKARVKEILPLIAPILKEVNNLPLEKQRSIIEENWPEALIHKKIEEKKLLPPLPNVENYAVVVTRFSPNPDAPIHLGSARAIILCHEYATMYNGKFLVRFEDTDPKLKKPQLQFYDFIKADLQWLQCEPSQYYIQSDRLPLYYQYAEQLLKEQNAYICTCNPTVFKTLLRAKQACPCRSLPPTDQVKRWQKMLDGTYDEKEAVVRIKTDLTHPNPAVRDWPALRIIDTTKYPHPRVGSKYRVWPLYNFACGIDDHIMGVTHIIRGKEHLTNQIRQEFMYHYLGWKYPEAIHYGRLKITGASLSKSKIVQGVRDGTFQSWDDPRLATFAALRRRGIQADAIKQLILDVGPKTQDVTLSWKNLYAHNRKIIESQANRYFFVHAPKLVSIHNIPNPVSAEIPLHPDYSERGVRQFNINPKDGVAKFWVATNDVKEMKQGKVIRFMELFNITVDTLNAQGVTASFHSQQYEKAKKLDAPLIHWLPDATRLKGQVVLPDASIAEGFVEAYCKEVPADTIVQFERFGFVRIDTNNDRLITAYYCHR